MPRKAKPFWALDAETDPFEDALESVARRECPECGAIKGEKCFDKHGGTHSARRRQVMPFIWGLYGGPNTDEYYEFQTVDEVVSFLQGRRDVVYAHNGGKFDYHYLRHHINTGEAISIIAGRLARFRIGECEFRDSMNILPVSLATFKKDEIDYKIMEPDARTDPNNMAKIRRYLRGDCQYLYELIAEHRKENGVALTQAGASMKAWSKQSKIKPPQQSAHAYQLYKPYYYGGRVQCFESGIQARDFQVIDINSAYPYAMLAAHPLNPVGILQAHLPPDDKIHRCLVTVKCAARGCFPYRSESGDLLFPHDEKTIRRYHVTGYELIAALELDACKHLSVETVHYFDQTVTFEEFILSNWDRRAKAKKEGNKALDIIVKLLMNSLYGKFASDYNKYREYELCHSENILEYVKPEARWPGDKYGFEIDNREFAPEKCLVSKPIPEDKHRFYNAATAASITGYVRAMLFRALSRVSDPLYCDTDSIACGNTRGLHLGDGLGAWKVEGAFDEYAIVGKKTYAFHKKGAPRNHDKDSKGQYLHWKTACKGVQLDPAQILQAAAGKPITHSPLVPTYSVKRQTPVFTDRQVRVTAKDIRIVPEEKVCN